ncbi:SRPBCC domain-containing protein [Flavivirga aquimarina]|uniref:SRPBCC domain-containing protein n=1 Tax=Flavivirga aquimarina TaxID=2027862 RepID=A0ABT8W6X6_9FLAO|nr:SRPBCC domain-containing protein [Flavivirga aquimarina]MDO5968817.1 SRPBCC domain-containing protein [Flavivirga aquimarina]
MNTQTLKQKEVFETSAKNLFDLLMNESKVVSYYGPGQIGRETGDSFALGGMIFGKNEKIVPNKLIQQAWRIVIPGVWPEDHFSNLTIELTEQDDKTILHLEQEGVPELCYTDLNLGWKTYYWDRIRKVLKGEKIPTEELINNV